MGPGPKAQTLDLTVRIAGGTEKVFDVSAEVRATLSHTLLLLTPVTVIPNRIKVPHQPLPHRGSATLRNRYFAGLTTHSRTRADNEFPVQNFCRGRSRLAEKLSAFACD